MEASTTIGFDDATEYREGRSRERARRTDDASSPIAIFSDQIDSSRAVGALTGPDRRSPSGNLRAAHSRTLCDQAPRFLLHGNTPKARLKPQTLSDFVV